MGRPEVSHCCPSTQQPILGLKMVICTLLFSVVACSPVWNTKFRIEEATIAEIQAQFLFGELTSRQLVDFYVNRTNAFNPTLNAIIEINPDICALADAADQARWGGKAKGFLHGIPVLLKDNIGTTDKLNTTAGSFALLGSKVTKEAFIVSLLRKAGALIFGKANLSEFMGTRSLTEPNGFSPRGGQTMDPYALERNPCGSSSGSAVAVAANLVTVSVGTETQGSLICPASRNAVVSIKPTPGLLSRTGLVPISSQFDTPGPMARTLQDAVFLLDEMIGFDSYDSLAARCNGTTPNGGYASHLHGLLGIWGKRIGVSRSPSFQEVPAYEVPVIDSLIGKARSLGGQIIDPVNIQTIGEIINGTSAFPSFRADAVLLLTDLKIQIETYLTTLIDSKVKTLADIILFDKATPKELFSEFLDSIFFAANETTGVKSPAYILAQQTIFNQTRDGLLKVFEEYNLDALIAPADSSLSVPASLGGFPVITIPIGYSPTDGLPFGLSILGLPCTESKIIEIAHAWEQASSARKRPPQF